MFLAGSSYPGRSLNGFVPVHEIPLLAYGCVLTDNDARKSTDPPKQAFQIQNARQFRVMAHHEGTHRAFITS